MIDDFNFNTPLTKENCYDQIVKACNSDKVWKVMNMMLLDAQYSQAMHRLRNPANPSKIGSIEE